jgi:FHA domain
MSGVVILVLRALLAVILYAFIGWALFTIWRQLHSTGRAILNRTAPLLTLATEDIALDPHEFTSPEIIVGRDPNCEFSLPDETVSSHHSHISYHHKQWWIEDLNSTNGTFLNGEKVTTPTVIITGDEIGIGRLKIQVAIK